MNRTQLDDKAFVSFVGRFETLPVARIWFGDYLALYLELGKRVGVYEESGRSKHERHIFAGYDWTLTDSNGEATQRSDLTEERVLRSLTNCLIRSVTLDACNELLIRFDNKSQITTRSLEHPEWSLYESPDTNVSFANGRPMLEAVIPH